MTSEAEDFKKESLEQLECDKAIGHNQGPNEDKQQIKEDHEFSEEELSISLSDGCNNESDKQQPPGELDEETNCSAKLNTTYDVLPRRSLSPSAGSTTNDSAQNDAAPNENDDGANITVNRHQQQEQQQEFSLQAQQIQLLVEQAKRQSDKINELEGALISTSRTCNQLECMLKQELNKRSALETNNLNLISEICKLRLRLNSADQLKKRDDEKINLLNATLMERETEISILKLKLTRAQTSAPSNNNLSPSSVMQPDSNNTQSSSSHTNQLQHSQQTRLRPPSQTYSITRLDNHVTTGSLQLNHAPRQKQQKTPPPSDYQPHYNGASSQQLAPAFSSQGSSLYASPVHLPASIIPLSSTTSENYAPSIYGNITSPYVATVGFNRSTTPLNRTDRHYRTLPRNMPSTNPSNNFYQYQQQVSATVNNCVYQPAECNYQNPRPHVYNKQRSYSAVDASLPSQMQLLCTVTNLDDGNESGQLTNQTNTFNKRACRDNPDEIISCDKSAYANVQSLTGSTNPNQPLVDDTHYSTIEKLGASQSGSKSLSGQSVANRQQPIGSYNISAPQHRLPSIPKQRTGLKRIFNKFRRSGSNSNDLLDADDILLTVNHNNNNNSSFKRGGTRSTTGGVFQSPSNNQEQHSMNMIMVNRQADTIKTTKPFGQWDTIMVADWLTTIGLSMYSNQCKRWAKSGSHIMNATASEVERGLGIGNTLHRKKLRLAISELNGDCDKITKAAANLDYLWVARWLDDIGLPQYKEQFINNRIDGRVLNYLTVEDLVGMNITSLLHHASIRCGIRVLRSINFDLQTLKRRATSDEIEGMMQWSSYNQHQEQSSLRSGTLTHSQAIAKKSSPINTSDSEPQSMLNDEGQSSHVTSDSSGMSSSCAESSALSSNTVASTPAATTTRTVAPAALGTTGVGSGIGASSSMPAQPDIALWTCHRVMEWLRLIDFAEFAPNLRGSGVHGGLIIYEDGFNADLMSSLLSIPDDKTLLRRHIYSLFKELIGMELFQQKRQYESHPHYTPLTPTAELKLAKKSQFSLLRRSRSKVGQDTTIEEYLCPMYPIDSRFMKHAASNAARDAANNHQQQQQQQQVDPKACSTYASNSQLKQEQPHQQITRLKQLASGSTNV